MQCPLWAWTLAAVLLALLLPPLLLLRAAARRSPAPALLGLPLPLLIIGIGALLSLQRLLPLLQGEHLLPLVRHGQRCLALLALTVLALRWKTLLLQELLPQNQQQRFDCDPTSLHLVHRFSSFVIIFVAGLIFLQLFGLSIAPLLTFGGIGAGAIGFASRDLNANFFGGLMLFLNRPFVEGESITLPSNNLEGCVEHIGWVLTRIRDKEQRLVTMPNSLFLNAAIFNHSRISHRRLALLLSVRHPDFVALSHIPPRVQRFFQQQETIAQQLPIHIHVSTLSDGLLELKIEAYTYCKGTAEYLHCQKQLLEELYQLLQQEIAASAQIALRVLP